MVGLIVAPSTVSFEVQGHRGAKGLWPENTLVGFAGAIDLGVTALEMDVGITADGVLVVCHDPYINRKLCLTARGKRLPRRPRRLLLNRLTLEQVKSYDCGSRNPDRRRFPQQQSVPGARIPTLQEVFDLAESLNPQIRYTIEVKVNPLRPRDTVGPELFARQVIAAVVQNQLEKRVIIQSFDWRVLRWVKQLHPGLKTSALIHYRKRKPGTLKSLPGLPSPFLAGFDYNQFKGNISGLLQAAGFIDRYSPNYETLLPHSPHFLQPMSEIQQAGFTVVPWTVNDPIAMTQLINLGVDGLITDVPHVLLSLLAERANGLRN